MSMCNSCGLNLNNDIFNKKWWNRLRRCVCLLLLLVAPACLRLRAHHHHHLQQQQQQKHRRQNGVRNSSGCPYRGCSSLIASTPNRTATAAIWLEKIQFRPTFRDNNRDHLLPSRSSSPERPLSLLLLLACKAVAAGDGACAISTDATRATARERSSSSNNNGDGIHATRTLPASRELAGGATTQSSPLPSLPHSASRSWFNHRLLLRLLSTARAPEREGIKLMAIVVVMIALAAFILYTPLIVVGTPIAIAKTAAAATAVSLRMKRAPKITTARNGSVTVLSSPKVHQRRRGQGYLSSTRSSSRCRPLLPWIFVFLLSGPCVPTAEALPSDLPPEALASATATAAADAAAKAATPQPLSLLLVCTTDGSIYSLDAWTGHFRSKVVSGLPLMTRFQVEKGVVTAQQQAQPQTMIVPGLDGKLYWQSSPTSPSSDAATVEELPMTVSHLLQHPVRTCPPEDQAAGTCGILSATSQTSFLALDGAGELLWKSNTFGSSTTTTTTAAEDGHQRQSSEKGAFNVLLQRKDYWIQEVSMDTGNLKWNASVGNYRAVTFEDDEEEDEQHFEADEDTEFGEDDFGERKEKQQALPSAEDEFSKSRAALPAVVFSHDAHRLSAVHPVTRQVLWITNTETMIASVFGVHAGKWKSLVVFQEESGGNDADGDENDDRGIVPTAGAAAAANGQDNDVPRLAATKHNNAFLDNFDYDGLWTQQLKQLVWSYSHLQGQKQRRRMLPGGVATEEEGLICDVHSSPDQCLDPLHPQGLLPAPPSVTTTDSRIVQLPDGLLLSWPAVVSLVLFAIAVVVVTLWVGYVAYYRKKRKWLLHQQESKEEQRQRERATALLPSSSSSSSPSQQGPVRHNSFDETTPTIKRSSSLPSNLRRTRSLSPSGEDSDRSHIRRPRRLSISPEHIKSSNAYDGSIYNNGEPIPGPEKHQEQQQPVLRTEDDLRSQNQTPPTVIQNGLPLYRYSRYATDFEEIRPLGKGGFGTVFHCKSKLDGRDIAIKKVLIQGSSNGSRSFHERLQRVLREIKILAVLEHPNIVPYYGAWLELEDKEEGDEQTRSRGTATLEEDSEWNNNRSMSRRFSSSLFAGTSEWPLDSSYSESHCNHRRLSDNGNNPLNWNNNHGLGNFAGADDLYLGPNQDDDCGFIFEESETNNDDNDSQSEAKSNANDTKDENNPMASSRSTLNNNAISATPSSRQGDEALAKRISKTANPLRENYTQNNLTATTPTAQDKNNVRHTLYIQMQLCRSQTVADFLTSPDSRKGRSTTNGNRSFDDGETDSSSIDIPTALRIFLQVAEAVKHVHEQGLIHRDLKPCNCFMDGPVNVKVGDFGLSRECTEGQNDGRPMQLQQNDSCGDLLTLNNGTECEENTAGVGTRSYASPEQMNGSDYDSMTDIYSLGIMLFELCFFMSTTMERNICFNQLRQQPSKFPKTWHASVGKAFPTLQDLIQSMLRHQPADRPRAKIVTEAIKSILSEFSCPTIDQKHHRNPDMIVLRVEAEQGDEALSSTLKAIRQAAPAADIVQHGMRSGTSRQQPENGQKHERRATSILEFAVLQPSNGLSDDDCRVLPSEIVSKLNERPGILLARNVSSGFYNGARNSQS